MLMIFWRLGDNGTSDWHITVGTVARTAIRIAHNIFEAEWEEGVPLK